MNFDKSLALLSDLKNRGELFIALSPPFAASMDIDHDVLQQALEENQILEAEFRRAASRIGNMLAATLRDSEDEFVRLSPGIGEDDERDSIEVEQLREEVQKVRDQLYDTHLQQRYDLKKSSKAPSFTDIDWDIKIKHFDAKLGEFKPFPYATCRLSFQREFEDTPFTIFGGRAFDAVQINFSIDDIDHVSRVLSRIRQRLEALENRGE